MKTRLQLRAHRERGFRCETQKYYQHPARDFNIIFETSTFATLISTFSKKESKHNFQGSPDPLITFSLLIHLNDFLYCESNTRCVHYLRSNCFVYLKQMVFKPLLFVCQHQMAKLIHQVALLITFCPLSVVNPQQVHVIDVFSILERTPADLINAKSNGNIEKDLEIKFGLFV